MPQKNYISHYEHLKNKWTERESELQKSLWKKHTDSLQWLGHHMMNTAAGSATAMMLFTGMPSFPVIVTSVQTVQQSDTSGVSQEAFLISDLYNKLPQTVEPLTEEQKGRITAILSARFGFAVTSELNGISLNTNYGLIGEEQHLRRYPDDTMNDQLPESENASKYWSSGLAPGLGAWGYFANSRQEMTQRDSDREKYYIAVQTFLTPGYNDHVAEYNTFFKYRKVLVVNPQNGKAMVVNIADAGPSPWTGKQLGGSPEVMDYLQRVDGSQKGPVLYFFVDDPNDTIPLGPITMKS